jgi:hypothetical protein
VLVVSDRLAYADLFAALEPASQRLSRKVAPTIYSGKEFQERLEGENAFALRVMAQPKLWLIGGEAELCP